MEPEKINISQDNLKKVFKSVLIGIGVIVYLLIIILAFERMKLERLLEDLKIFAGTFLVIGIIFLEQAYKRDDGFKAINGIEMWIISAYTLSMRHAITVLQFDIPTYIWNSVYVVAIYYVIKAFISYTYGKKQYLNSFNDIAEIVKEEPQKKTATKKRTTQTKKESASAKRKFTQSKGKKTQTKSKSLKKN